MSCNQKIHAFTAKFFMYTFPYSWIPNLSLLIVKGIYKNLPHDSQAHTPSTPSYAFIHSIRVVRSLKFSDQPRKRPQTCCWSAVQIPLFCSLSQIPIRISLRAVYALQVFTLNERLDAFLNHGDLGFKLADELAEGFGHELLMREFFALSISLSV